MKSKSSNGIAADAPEGVSVEFLKYDGFRRAKSDIPIADMYPVSRILVRKDNLLLAAPVIVKVDISRFHAYSDQVVPTRDKCCNIISKTYVGNTVILRCWALSDNRQAIVPLAKLLENSRARWA